MKKIIKAAAVFGMAAALTACGSNVPANTVFSIDDLPGKTIGVQLGTVGDTYSSDYEDLSSDVFPKDYEGEASTVERFNKGADAVQALKQGKIDCVIIDSEPAKAFVDVNDDLKILEEDFAEEEYAICIKKGNTELKDKVNLALEQIKAEGTLDSIIKNYIGDDTKGKSPYESPADTDRSNGTLIMATNAEFKPYEYMEGDKVTGIDADIAQAICDILGMELKIENMEFDSIISAVTSGKADVGIAGMTITEDRLENIDFSEPYTTSKQVIIVRKK